MARHQEIPRLVHHGQRPPVSDHRLLAVSQRCIDREPGLVQRDLESVTGGGRSAVFTGVIFGLFHLNPLSIIPLITLGVFFGFLVHRSQNITLAMVAHFLNNFLATVAVYFQMDEDFMLVTSFGQAGPGAVAANTGLFALVFLGVMYYFVSVNGRRLPA